MALAAYKVTAPGRLSDLVKYEINPDYCRESYTLKAGSGAERKIALGGLLAMSYAITSISAAAAADGGNTGNGTLTLADPAVTAAAIPGIYTVVCTTGGADGTSKFRVEDPLGSQVGTATGGTAFAKSIKFTIAGGGTNFVEGDKFTVTVSIDESAAENKIVEWAPTATDGTERVWGCAMNAITAPDGTDQDGGLALRRGAIVAASAIAWPTGVTDAQKLAAIDMLSGMGIAVR